MNTDISKDSLIIKQVILNKEQEIIGYDLSIAKNNNLDTVIDTNDAQKILCELYSELGIKQAIGDKKIYITIDNELAIDPIIETILNPNDATLVLHINEYYTPDKLNKLINLFNRKFTFGYDNFKSINDEKILQVRNYVKILRINIDEFTHKELADCVSGLSNIYTFMANNISSLNDFEYCKELGFTYFKGNYFANPQIVKGKKLSSNQITLIKIINLLRKDVDNHVLEEQIKKAPTLAVNLISIVNTADRGLSKKVSTVKDAISLLGRNKIARLMQLLLMVPDETVGDIKKSPILQVAVLRGDIMERMAAKIDPFNSKLKDDSFITGLLSMLPVALSISLNTLLDYIELNDEIKEALIHKDGILGTIYKVIEAYDNEHIEEYDKLLNTIPKKVISRQMMNRFLIESLEWINGE